MVSPSRGVTRLSSGLSSLDGGQGSSNSASGENSAQTSWQGQGPGSRASSAQSSLHGLSVSSRPQLLAPCCSEMASCAVVMCGMAEIAGP